MAAPATPILADIDESRRTMTGRHTIATRSVGYAGNLWVASRILMPEAARA